jgi:hypothetical protein
MLGCSFNKNHQEESKILSISANEAEILKEKEESIHLCSFRMNIFLKTKGGNSKKKLFNKNLFSN